MDKTTNLAKPRSINKRGQRRDIYNNETGEILRHGKTVEGEKRIIDYGNDVDIAARLTMRNYFSDDWFDDDNYYTNTKRKEGLVRDDRSRGSAITPQRCTECKRPFQRLVSTPTGGKFTYINSKLFANMPLVEGICGNCE